MNYLPLYSYYHNLKIALPLYEFTFCVVMLGLKNINLGNLSL